MPPGGCRWRVRDSAGLLAHCGVEEFPSPLVGEGQGEGACGKAVAETDPHPDPANLSKRSSNNRTYSASGSYSPHGEETEERDVAGQIDR